MAPMPGGFNSSGLANYDNGLVQQTIADKVKDRRQQYRHTCAKCGARRVDKQIGLEALHDCLGWATGNRCCECHVCVIVEVMRLVREVLDDSGVLFLNYGDSYANNGQTGLNIKSSTPTLGPNKDGLGENNAAWVRTRPCQTVPHGLKPKDLVGMPWRIALALQADGWWLRSDIIFAKKNPMPESVQGSQMKRHMVRGETETMVECPGCEKCEPYGGYIPFLGAGRPTKAHEYLFLLSKRPDYFYDAEAVKEKNAEPSGSGGWQSAVRNGDYNKYHGLYPSNKTEGASGGSKVKTGARVLDGGRNRRTVWTIPADNILSQPAYRIRDDISDEQLAKVLDEICEPVEITIDRPVRSHEYLFLLSKRPDYFYDSDAIREQHSDIDYRQRRLSVPKYRGESARWTGQDREEHDYRNPAGRNRRSVWNISTEAYPQAHFATFPRKLVEPTILAGTSQRGHCPECGARWARVVDVDYKDAPGGSRRGANNNVHGAGEFGVRTNDRAIKNVTTTGWCPGCSHGLEPVPDVVLDPFAGSGTVGAVAEQLGRKYILIDLSRDYEKMQQKRTAQMGMAL